MQSVYSTAPADWATRTLVGEVLPLCTDSVGVFYSTSRLGHQDTRWGSLTVLQRFNRCILPPQPTGPGLFQILSPRVQKQLQIQCLKFKHIFSGIEMSFARKKSVETFNKDFGVVSTLTFNCWIYWSNDYEMMTSLSETFNTSQII